MVTRFVVPLTVLCWSVDLTTRLVISMVTRVVTSLTTRLVTPFGETLTSLSADIGRLPVVVPYRRSGTGKRVDEFRPHSEEMAKMGRFCLISLDCNALFSPSVIIRQERYSGIANFDVPMLATASKCGYDLLARIR